MQLQPNVADFNFLDLCPNAVNWDQSARYVLVCSLHARQLVTGFGRLDSGREGRYQAESHKTP